MKLIPLETEFDLEFESLKLNEATKDRIKKVREKIKLLESTGNKNILLRLVEILIDVVEQWESEKNLSLINRAIHCLQKANTILAKEKTEVLKL